MLSRQRGGLSQTFLRNAPTGAGQVLPGLAMVTCAASSICLEGGGCHAWSDVPCRSAGGDSTDSSHHQPACAVKGLASGEALRPCHSGTAPAARRRPGMQVSSHWHTASLLAGARWSSERWSGHRLPRPLQRPRSAGQGSPAVRGAGRLPGAPDKDLRPRPWLSLVPNQYYGLWNSDAEGRGCRFRTARYGHSQGRNFAMSHAIRMLATATAVGGLALSGLMTAGAASAIINGPGTHGPGSWHVGPGTGSHAIGRITSTRTFAGYQTAVSAGSPTVATASFTVPTLSCTTTDRAIAPDVGVAENNYK